MDSGEILTRTTIWLSMVAYAAGLLIFAFVGKSLKRDTTVRLLWTFACAVLLVHVVCAFHFYHRWSHAAAYLDTARQTRDVVGTNWGGGLYVNYALLIGWIADVGWWWLSGLHSYRRRPWLIVVAWHAFLIFIIFNATVIFGSGFTRWAGLVLCLGLFAAWWRIVRGDNTLA